MQGYQAGAQNPQYRHGQYGTRLYEIWRTMKKRCTNPKHGQYRNYGGRGIQLCEEWKDFRLFYEWAIKSGYADNLTLERIDNGDNYSPENCRWATIKEQANNRRSNHIIEYAGERLTLAQWSEKLGVSWACLYERLRKGWTIERALTTPHPRKRRNTENEK